VAKLSKGRVNCAWTFCCWNFLRLVYALYRADADAVSARRADSLEVNGELLGDFSFAACVRAEALRLPRNFLAMVRAKLHAMSIGAELPYSDDLTKQGREPEPTGNVLRSMALARCPLSGCSAPCYALMRKRLETFMYGRRAVQLLTSHRARETGESGNLPKGE